MGSLANLIYSLQPEEIYHLTAQSHVRVSFDVLEYTGEVTAPGTMRIWKRFARVESARG